MNHQAVIFHQQAKGHAVVVALVNVLFPVQDHKSSHALTNLFEYAILHVRPVSLCDNDVVLLVQVVPSGDHSYFVAVHHQLVQAHVTLVCDGVFVPAFGIFSIIQLQLAVVHPFNHVQDQVYMSVHVVTVPAVHALHLSVDGATTLDLLCHDQHAQFTGGNNIA